MKIDLFGAPVMVTWQLTRDCDLACLHCCTESAPGKAMPNELTREEALRLADQLVAAELPYVMLAGGEPTIVPHFWDVAERLGRGGVYLKVETNGQRFGAEEARRLSALPVRSLQVSIDGATQAVYGRQRPGGSLEKALAAARAAVGAGLPLEITFAPTRLNLMEAEAVVALAVELGAFRFNTGRLMKLGTAAKLWERLDVPEARWADYLAMLERKEAELAGRIELCFRPFSMDEELQTRREEPAGTLLIQADGKVRLSGGLGQVCADLRTQTISQAWAAYRRAWKDLPALV